MVDDTAAALSNATVRAKLEIIGMIVSPSTPDELGAFIKAEIDKWGVLIKKIGLKPN